MPIRYFIPDWDDRVDPNFDFETDTHTPDRDPYRDDVYMHEIFSTPPYDGMLLSHAVLDASPSKRAAIVAAGSVHRYLRLPADSAHLVMGDCGAFTYWRQDEPPYDTREVLDYYQELGFDLGVSIDHLIFTEVEADKERRWNITVRKAEEFLRLHRTGSYTFTPVGVAQGWDPGSYRRAVEALIDMGYEYIAIGGLVRSPTPVVLRTLSAIKPILPPSLQVHLFGVTRPEFAHEFANLGITSFDSASRLRRAWMDGRRNYFLGHGSFTAIRIPYAAGVAKKTSVSPDEVTRLEQAALAAVRQFDQGLRTLEDTLDAVRAYDCIAAPELTTGRDYERTLSERPWRECPCTVCREIGVEVLIFRGNNRNRRRGFHNTWQLYQQLHSGGRRPLPSSELAFQLELNL